MTSEKNNAETYFCLDDCNTDFDCVFCFFRSIDCICLLFLLDHGFFERASNDIGSKMNVEILKKIMTWLCVIAIALIFGIILIPLMLITVMLNFFVAEMEIPKHTGWNGHL